MEKPEGLVYQSVLDPVPVNSMGVACVKAALNLVEEARKAGEPVVDAEVIAAMRARELELLVKK